MWGIDDLSGQKFGIWKVLNFDHMKWNGANHKHGMSYYKCQCVKCGQIHLKARSDLIQNPGKKHRGCEVKLNAKAI